MKWESSPFRAGSSQLEESITFSVSDSHNQVIFEKKIPVDGSYFSNLAALPDEKGQRKPYWCELAGEVFAEYDER